MWNNQNTIRATPHIFRYKRKPNCGIYSIYSQLQIFDTNYSSIVAYFDVICPGMNSAAHGIMYLFQQVIYCKIYCFHISRQHPRNVIVDVSELVYIAIRGNKTYQINLETHILKCIFEWSTLELLSFKIKKASPILNTKSQSVLCKPYEN